MRGDAVTAARKKATLNMTTYASHGSLKLKFRGTGPTRDGTRKFFIAMKNCVAMFGLVGPSAGKSIGTAVEPTVTAPIDVVRLRTKRMMTTTMTIRKRWRSSSRCSKNVIRRSLGRISSEATSATGVIVAKWARLIGLSLLCDGSERITVL